uniref:Uncharacterized protein n=1 Tax=Pyxicephalus adspersus TaxID=30357 RepID=A0AAV3AER6_PYXAD|nr:TPA: hypothetical protein GDO54_012620 [Pyxicephalus adspersus]
MTNESGSGHTGIARFWYRLLLDVPFSLIGNIFTFLQSDSPSTRLVFIHWRTDTIIWQDNRLKLGILVAVWNAIPEKYNFTGICILA